MSNLNVFFEDQLVGQLSRDEELIHSFKYDSDWLSSLRRFQLSLALPLQEEAFGNRPTLSFFENLLPEGEVREVLGKDHQIESSFEYLKKFGKDCAGAIIISSTKTSPFQKEKQGIVEINMNKIYEAIESKRSVVEVISATAPGYLSLAGAQDKFPAIYKDEGFYLPTYGAPTTHIVKVPIWRMGVKESVFNEYYCMKLARAVGLNVPDCFVLGSHDHPLFVIKRYDRFIGDEDIIHRMHQQDFCQAQGIVSEQKYEEKGGPTIKDNYQLIVNNSWVKKRAQNIFSYIDWICFNLLVGNNDCHSKNISLLLKDGRIELAPFYDLLCTAIYPKLKGQFPYNIGNRNEVSKIGKNQLNLLNEELRLKSGTILERMILMRDKLMEHKGEVVSVVLEEYSRVKIVKRISNLIEDRCRSLSRQGVL